MRVCWGVLRVLPLLLLLGGKNSNGVLCLFAEFAVVVGGGDGGECCVCVHVHLVLGYGKACASI